MGENNSTRALLDYTIEIWFFFWKTDKSFYESSIQKYKWDKWQHDHKKNKLQAYWKSAFSLFLLECVRKWIGTFTELVDKTYRSVIDEKNHYNGREEMSKIYPTKFLGGKILYKFVFLRTLGTSLSYLKNMDFIQIETTDALSG